MQRLSLSTPAVRRLIVILLSYLLMLSMTGLPVNAQSTLDVTLLEDVQVDPPLDVELTVRVVRDGFPVTGLNASDVSFSDADDSTNKQIVQREGPLNLVILADAGLGNPVDTHVEAMRSLVEDDQFFREGDEVTFLFQRGGTDVDGPYVANSVPDALDTINLLGNATDDGTVTSVGLQQALNIALDADMPTHVVYFSAIVFSPRNLDEVLQQYRVGDVPLHVVRNHFDRSDDRITSLAGRTGGQYVNNNEGNLVQNQRPVGELRTLYSLLNNNRVFYEITYTATRPGIEERTVEMTVQDENGNRGQVTYTYTPQLSPPDVEIVSPTQLNPQRSFNPQGELDNPVTPVYVRVTFPDGIRRTLSELRLQILDDNGNELQSPTTITNPVADGDNTYQLEWDLRDYTIENSATAFTMQATARDTYGLQGETAQTGTVRVGVVPTLVPTALPDEPFVSIIEPQPLDITRRYVEPESDELTNDTINLRLSYLLPPTADGDVTSLARAEVFIQRPDTDLPAQEPIILENPTPLADNELQIPWDLSAYNTENEVNNLILEIILTGTDGEAVNTGRVPATVSVASRPTLDNVFLCSLVGISARDCSIRDFGDELLFGTMLLMVLGTGGLAAYFRFTEKGQAQFSQIQESATQIYDNATNIFRENNTPAGPGKQAYAVLHIAPDSRWDASISTIDITKPDFTLGRSIRMGADYQIPLQDISRNHCTILYTGDEFEVIDNNSAGKTYLNDRPLQPDTPARIEHGDQLRLYTYEMTFTVPGEDQAAVPEPFDEMADTNVFQDRTRVQDASSAEQAASLPNDGDDERVYTTQDFTSDGEPFEVGPSFNSIPDDYKDDYDDLYDDDNYLDDLENLANEEPDDDELDL